MAYILQNIYKVCYAENYRMREKSMREIKRGLNKWRNIPYSCIGTNNIFKVPVLPDLIHRFSIIPIKTCSLVAQLVKNLPAMQDSWIRCLDWEDPLEKGRLPTQEFWPGEFHGLCSPWSHEESDITDLVSPSQSQLNL